LKGLGRIFKYVWPQWPRVVVVVMSALLVALLLSVSFITIIPLMKVMMDKEGVHGYADRKSCSWKYGLDFYIPDTMEMVGSNGGSLAYYLLVTNVEKGSLAEAAGLKSADRIVGVGDSAVSDTGKNVAFSRLLQELGTTNENTISLQVRRLDSNDVATAMTIVLSTPCNDAYIKNLGWGRFKRMKLGVKAALIDRVQVLVARLPREQNVRGKTKTLIYIMVMITLITIIRCLAKFYQDYLAEKVVQVSINHLREDAFGRALHMPMGFFATERPSDTVSRIVRDTSVMGKAIKIMLGKALREPLNAAVMAVFAMLINWQLTLLFMCASPLVLGLLALFGGKMKKATRRSLVASSQMLAKLEEVMSGLGVVKVYNQQDYEQKSFKRINDRLLKQLLKISKVDSATMPTLEILGMIAGGLALVTGAHLVMSNHGDGSEFLMLLILLGAIAESVRKTSRLWNRIQEANAAGKRVFSVIDQPIEEEMIGAFELPPLRDNIVFEDVVFSYPQSQSPVLKGVNFRVQAGHNVAIVGPNGSGKTTLANLMPRFYDPDSGRILIDGKDIRDATLFSLRSQIGMVTQNTVTFNDTIAANIAYGKPGASREEIVAAAKRSFADEFVSVLPNGYDSVIGEKGTGLSGGQLQRIVIARAILNNPAILIFDEATSQVDADSEAKIHAAIEEIMRDRTSFIIAHRFSTVVSADVIVVMDDGRILAQGEHNELIQSCSLYQSLYETQLVKE